MISEREEQSEGLKRLGVVSEVISEYTDDITSGELREYVREQAWQLAADAVREGRNPVQVLRGLQAE